ncbi:MAG: hypothetical protein AAB361_00510 [Patescibacteria group bacterium]
MSKEPGEPNFNLDEPKKIKSSEETRFESLVEDARHRPLSPNYAFVETKEDAKDERADSMEVAYKRSGDIEKIAMFDLQSVQADTGGLAAVFQADQKELVKRATAKIEIILSKIGIDIPQNLKEAEELTKKIITFENWQKIINCLKKSAENN